MKEGMKAIIDAKENSIQQSAIDVSYKLSTALGDLIALHTDLENQKPLSFSEFAQSSSSVQLLLEQLKTKSVPTDEILEILQLILKENK